MIRRMKNFGLVSSLILLTFLTSCLDSYDFPDTSAQLALDVQKIEKYLTDNDIDNFVKDPSGVFYVIHQQGTGELPLNGQHVNLTYEAKLLNGTATLFEQTSMPVFLTVGNISIVGLSTVLPKLAEGTTATVYIPSGLAYGTGSSATIPANSNFIFDLEIFDVATSATEIFEVQKNTIDQYLADNEIENVITHESGLRYTIEVEGTGDMPALTNSISVKYKGTMLSNGEKFDESVTGTTLALSTLIEGWKIALPLLKEGTKATLYIPSKLGYGTTGSNAIPPNAILKFEVELVEVI